MSEAIVKDPTDAELLEVLRLRIRDVVASFEQTNTLIHPGNAASWVAMCDLQDSIPRLLRDRTIHERRALVIKLTAEGVKPTGEPINLSYKGLPGPDVPRVFPCLCGGSGGTWRVKYLSDDRPVCVFCDSPMVFVTPADEVLYETQLRALAQERDAYDKEHGVT
jgi:hypothetical protein